MTKKQLTISIPTPCTEDWNAMTPHQSGKFCASCQKTVVDFSRMSDAEIFNYFDNFKGATCGNFSEKQLNTPIIEPLILKPQNRWAWALSALLLPTIAASQTAKINEATEVVTPSVFETKSVVGNDFLSIEGEVRELGGNFLPVDGAIVAVNINTKIVAYGQTDSLGIFSINLPKTYENQAFALVVSQIGYEKEQLLFEKFTSIKGNRLFISLKNEPISLEEGVVCTGFNVMTKKGYTTGVMTTTSVTTIGAMSIVKRFTFLKSTIYRLKKFFQRFRRK
jgi:hypothetical protein